MKLYLNSVYASETVSEVYRQDPDPFTKRIEPDQHLYFESEISRNLSRK